MKETAAHRDNGVDDNSTAVIDDSADNSVSADADTDAKRPQLGEVARRAGVSTATVSRVINGRDGVSAATRRKVEETMTILGYNKPLVSTKTTQTIELVLTEVMPNGTTAMIAAASSYAQQLGIGITITQTGRGGRNAENFHEVLDRNPLGVIVLFSSVTQREQEQLRSRSIPFVIIDPVGDVPAYTLGVGIDNWTGGLVATEHLIKLGHRRIGIITGPEDSESSQARYSGYMSALRRAKIELDPRLVAHGNYLPDLGYQAACTLLDLPEDERPTAIFACNDLTAVNVYSAARERGIRLPEELSIVGFDNVYPSQYLFPALTTINQPFDLITRKAIDMILDTRAGKAVDHYSILPTNLVVRTSTAEPHKADAR